jgi:hypothetical protein
VIAGLDSVPEGVIRVKEGPPLENLLRRLEDCPPDFLGEPIVGRTGTVRVEAVVADLAHDLGDTSLPSEWVAAFQAGDSKEARNFLRLVLVAAWLLHDPWFRQQGTLGRLARQWLATGPREVSQIVPASKFVSDPERREELARAVLWGLGLRPAGETDEQAQDRLDTLNSLERQRVIRASKAAEQRSRAIREALAKKAAQEAADKWNRE